MNKIRNKICELLCEKSSCQENINKCDGKMMHRCRSEDIKNSFINNLNDNQIEYIVSDIKENIFLKACPGSGKTEVLGIKSAYEIKKLKNENKGLAILTFTNSAEDEIRNRVEMYLGEKLKYPNFIGTFTSWIHGYIANPFLSKITKYNGDKDKDKSIRLIENGSNYAFINSFSSKYKYKELGYINPSEYYFDYKTGENIIYCGKKSRNGQQILDSLLSSDSDKWRSDDLKKLKNKFCEKGFYLYEDIECLVYKLLYKNEDITKLIASRFPIILIDECQDLSYIQLDIIKLINKYGCKIHLIGDLDQAIYGFRNIEPNDTIKFIEDLDFLEMKLSKNYRSCQKIVDITDLIIDRNSDIEGCQKQKLQEPLIVMLYEKDKEIEVLKKFDSLVNINCLSKKNSKIIVRNNNLKYKLLGIKNENKSSNNIEDLARAIYMYVNLKNVDEFKMSFTLFAKAIQRIYFKESEHQGRNFFYKPSELEMDEWRKLIFEIKNILISNDELLDFSISWSSWKANLNKIMKDSVNILSNLEDRECDLGRINNGNKDKTLKEVLSYSSERKLEYKVETIHGCKGMSLDAVLFLSTYKKSSDKDSGGYWTEWFDVNQISEKNRLAYVAFSRAKHLLVLGIPKTNNFNTTQRKRIIESGFEIIEI